MCKDMLLDDMDLDMVVGGQNKYLVYTSGDKYYAFGFLKSNDSLDTLKSRYAGNSMPDPKTDRNITCTSGPISKLGGLTKYWGSKGFEYTFMN